MPSVIHNHTQTSAPSSSPSGLEFVPDSSIYTNPSSSSPKPTVHDLKGSSRLQRLRQQWSDPDDEFSVPIHTEYPLITKNHPLDISSFLLNYRTMHRSIEIMTPPVVSQISNDETSTGSSAAASTSHFYPSIPDGPIYIHHRSTISSNSLSHVVSCPHVQCFEHNRGQLHVMGRTGGASACQNKTMLPGLNRQSEQEEEENSREAGLKSQSSSAKSSRRSSFSSTASSPTSFTSSKDNSHASQGHSFLESHIAFIGQWLSSNTAESTA